jgi:hypothetical protein
VYYHSEYIPVEEGISIILKIEEKFQRKRWGVCDSKR